MHEYTIDGDCLIPYDNRLFKKVGRCKDIEELEEGTYYLQDGQIGQFEIQEKPYHSFDAIFIPREDPEFKTYYTVGDTGNLGEDFDSVCELEQITPDSKIECPECGGWAGDKDDPNSPNCYSCGYGLNQKTLD